MKGLLNNGIRVRWNLWSTASTNHGKICDPSHRSILITSFLIFEHRRASQAWVSFRFYAKFLLWSGIASSHRHLMSHKFRLNCQCELDFAGRSSVILGGLLSFKGIKLREHLPSAQAPHCVVTLRNLNCPLNQWLKEGIRSAADTIMETSLIICHCASVVDGKIDPSGRGLEACLLHESEPLTVPHFASRRLVVVTRWAYRLYQMHARSRLQSSLWA